jgi:hypothetical protein
LPSCAGKKVLRRWYYDLDRARGAAFAVFGFDVFEVERFGFSVNTCETVATLSATSRVAAAARPTFAMTVVARCLSFATPFAACGFLAFLVFERLLLDEADWRRAAIEISL